MKSSANQCNHNRAICQGIVTDLLNPDPRIRECRARLLGRATKPNLMAIELRAISSVIIADAANKDTLLDGHTVSLLEDAVIQLQETISLMPPSLTRDIIIQLCAATLHLIQSWVEKHGLTPAALECPGQPQPLPSSPWQKPAPYTPEIKLAQRPRAKIKEKVLDTLGSVVIAEMGGVQ